MATSESLEGIHRSDQPVSIVSTLTRVYRDPKEKHILNVSFILVLVLYILIKTKKRKEDQWRDVAG